MPSRDPLQVTVAGVESIPGEGMELRLLVKLRVQNPNDAPIDFNGVSLNLDVMGHDFASGVSDEAGTVPRFGEAVIAVPVTVSMMRMARQVLGMLDGEPVDKVTYAMSGKLHGASMFILKNEPASRPSAGFGADTSAVPSRITSTPMSLRTDPAHATIRSRR